VITYAQNFEDVILARVIARREKGFYVDVGAGDPDHMSVTKWFYDLEEFLDASRPSMICRFPSSITRLLQYTNVGAKRSTRRRMSLLLHARCRSLMIAAAVSALKFICAS
jgi:hypothetical protein